MEEYIQRFPSYNVDFYIQVSENGSQVPIIKMPEFKILEYWINNNDNRLDKSWYESIKSKVVDSDHKIEELVLNGSELEILNNYKVENLLTEKLSQQSFKEGTNRVSCDSFLLRLAMYYSEESLFPILHKLKSFFDYEERDVIQEIQSVTIRNEKTLIEGYVFYEYPEIINTSDLFLVLDNWFEFIDKWNKGLII